MPEVPKRTCCESWINTYHHQDCTKPTVPPEWSERANESVRFPGVRWSPADLDRCQHGRHSKDSCYDCPGGKSGGNLFLDPHASPRMRETRMDRNQIRIGTMYSGEPIWVTYRSSDD